MEKPALFYLKTAYFQHNAVFFCNMLRFPYERDSHVSQQMAPSHGGKHTVQDMTGGGLSVRTADGKNMFGITVYVSKIDLGKNRDRVFPQFNNGAIGKGHPRTDHGKIIFAAKRLFAVNASMIVIRPNLRPMPFQKGANGLPAFPHSQNYYPFIIVFHISPQRRRGSPIPPSKE